jgi:hypothetical protein
MPNYMRVLPRDAFNEANLLKCIGQLTLLMHDKGVPGLQYEYDGEPFKIVMDDSDGSIFVKNIQFYLNSKPIEFKRPMNSRQHWPLIESETGEPVFDENGNYVLNISEVLT